MIADTTFLIDLMNGNKDAVQKLQNLSQKREQLHVTAISIFELYRGISRSGRPLKESEKILSVLQGVSTLSLEPASAQVAGEIEGKLFKDGRAIGSVDCMIAGIAITQSEKLLTRNVKDFSKISGLQVESY